MERLSCTHQPTLRHLLATGAMAGAQLVWGEDFIDQPVMQVASQLDPLPMAGSLVVTTKDVVLATKNLVLDGLPGVTYISQSDHERSATLAGIKGGIGATDELPAGSGAAGKRSDAAALVGQTSEVRDPVLEKLLLSCRGSDVPLIVMPSFGEPVHILEDIRLAFLKETKMASA